MKNHNSLWFPVVVLTFLITLTTSNFFTRLDSLQGQLTQQHVLNFSHACEPCHWKITVTDTQIRVHLYSTNYIQEFNTTIPVRQLNYFEIISGHNDSRQQVEINEKTQITQEVYTSYVARRPFEGLFWEFRVHFPQHGIIITSTHLKNTYIVIVLIALYSILSIITLSLLSRSKLQNITRQLVYRTHIISLLLTIFQTAIITTYLLFIICTYVLHSSLIILMLVYYACLVLPMAISLTITVVLLSSFIRKLRKLFPDPIVLMPITLLTFFAIVAYPFLITYWPKSQLFLIFCTLPIPIQYLSCIFDKKFPLSRYVNFSIMGTVFLMLIQSEMPMLHFTQISFYGMARVLLIISIEVIAGSIALRFAVGREIVDVLAFEKDTREIEMEGNQDSRKGNSEVTEEDIRNRVPLQSFE